MLGTFDLLALGRDQLRADGNFQRVCCAKRSRIVAFATAMLFASPSAGAITIDVRLSCELSGGCEEGDFFYDHPEALETLRFASRAFEPFADQLSAISPVPTWTATFTNPETGSIGFGVTNLAIPADTLVIFAGGRDFDDNQAGSASVGRSNVDLDRGQGDIEGLDAEDFSLWGGAVAFDTLLNGQPRKWNFAIDAPPAPGETDFLTVAVHELAHILGFGTADSFENHISGEAFLGPAVVELVGGGVQVTPPDFHHWTAGATSPPYEPQRPSALTASLNLGRRTLLTPLDYAAMADIGWEVPEQLLGLHGDADGDGDVDGRDFLEWQRDFGAANTLAALGDTSGDLAVDDYDLWLWQNNFGARAAPAETLAAFGSQVPEPATVTLVTLAVVLSCLERRPLRTGWVQQHGR